jgi:hypothetical protein
LSLRSNRLSAAIDWAHGVHALAPENAKTANTECPESGGLFVV